MKTVIGALVVASVLAFCANMFSAIAGPKVCPTGTTEVNGKCLKITDKLHEPQVLGQQ